MDNGHRADAIDRNPFRAEAMAMAAHGISTDASRADADTQIWELATQGFTHFPDRVGGAELDEVRAVHIEPGEVAQALHHDDGVLHWL